MIGGYDISSPGPVDRWDADRLLRLVRVVWPAAWVEFDTDPEGFVVDLAGAIRRSVPPPAAMFIYRTEADAASWTAHGQNEENAANMVFVMTQSDFIAFVVNAPDSASADLVRSIIGALRRPAT